MQSTAAQFIQVRVHLVFLLSQIEIPRSTKLFFSQKPAFARAGNNYYYYYRTSAINNCFPTSSPLSTSGLPSLWTSASSIRHCSMVWQHNSWCCLNTLFIFLIIATCSSMQSQKQQIVHANNFTL